MNGSTGRFAESVGSTSASLLRRLKDRQQDAWIRMTRIYGPLVYRWCRRSGVRADDIADVAQDVFQAVVASIDGFRRQRPGDSFRGWLYGITRHKVNDHFRRLVHRRDAAGGTEAQLHMGQIPFEADNGDESATSHDDRTVVLHRALDLIRSEFEERNWQAFWRASVEQQSSTDIASDLGMTPNAVRQAKYRVLRRLRRELEDLE
jgi:RNA polymerase sigma-70 factor (ECF subfamily)